MIITVFIGCIYEATEVLKKRIRATNSKTLMQMHAKTKQNKNSKMEN